MSTEEQAEAVRRLKSIEGHVRGVTRMVKEDQYSLSIIQQIQAIQGALEKLNLLILGAHLHECVAIASVARMPRSASTSSVSSWTCLRHPRISESQPSARVHPRRATGFHGPDAAKEPTVVGRTHYDCQSTPRTRNH